MHNVIGCDVIPKRNQSEFDKELLYEGPLFNRRLWAQCVLGSLLGAQCIWKWIKAISNRLDIAFHVLQTSARVTSPLLSSAVDLPSSPEHKERVRIGVDV